MAKIIFRLVAMTTERSHRLPMGKPLKKVNEKPRECHSHKLQPFPDTKRKRKQTKPNKRKSNKRTKSTKISSLFPKRGNRNAKRKYIFSITSGKIINIFGSYDCLMTVYPDYAFYDQCPFRLVAMATLNFKTGNVLPTIPPKPLKQYDSYLVETLLGLGQLIKAKRLPICLLVWLPW